MFPLLVLFVLHALLLRLCVKLALSVASFLISPSRSRRLSPKYLAKMNGAEQIAVVVLPLRSPGLIHLCLISLTTIATEEKEGLFSLPPLQKLAVIRGRATAERKQREGGPKPRKFVDTRRMTRFICKQPFSFDKEKA